MSEHLCMSKLRIELHVTIQWLLSHIEENTHNKKAKENSQRKPPEKQLAALGQTSAAKLTGGSLVPC